MRNWRDDAACLPFEDPEMWFRDSTRFPQDVFDTLSAKVVCRSCPVRAECLQFATAHGLGHGVWGGLDGEERTRLRRRELRRANAGVIARKRVAAERSVEAAAMYASGLTVLEIAGRLGVHEHTARGYLKMSSTGQ